MKHSISFTLKGALCFLVCTLLLVITIVTLFIPEVCYKKLYEKRLEELCKSMVNQGGLELSDVLADFDQRIDERILICGSWFLTANHIRLRIIMIS